MTQVPHLWSSDISIVDLTSTRELPDLAPSHQLGHGDVSLHSDLISRFSARVQAMLPSGSAGRTAWDNLQANTGDWAEPVLFRVPESETLVRLLGFGDGTSDTWYIPALGASVGEVWSGVDHAAAYSLLDANRLDTASASWETTPAGYSAVGSATVAQKDTRLARDGTGVASVTATGAAYPGVALAKVAASAGGAYTVMVSGRSGFTSLQVFIKWYDSGVSYLGSSGVASGTPSETEWLDLATTVTAPANTASAEVVARMNGTPTSGTVALFDCFGIHSGTPASAEWHDPADSVKAITLTTAPAAGVPVYAEVTGYHLYRCRAVALPTLSYGTSGHRHARALRLVEI